MHEPPVHAPADAVPGSDAPADANPILVEVVRGDMVESRHRGAVAVVDARGTVIGAWGDVERTVYPRSALKPLQALALVETGGIEAFGLDDRHIALACASHEGEPVHVELVDAWLARLGLDADDLECGPQIPRDREAMEALLRGGGTVGREHNNCSGKHAGFLTVARQLDVPTRHYTRYDHPVQQRLLGLLEQLSGLDLRRAPRGIDGCGIPVIGMALLDCAYAMARFAAPDDLPPDRAVAARRVCRAMTAHPELVGGRRQFTSLALKNLAPRAILKVGAEGVYTAAIPGDGVGIALKIDDGAARAAEVAIAAVLRRLGAYDPARHGTLTGYLDAPLRNWAGTPVGSVRPAAAGPF